MLAATIRPPANATRTGRRVRKWTVSPPADRCDVVQPLASTGAVVWSQSERVVATIVRLKCAGVPAAPAAVEATAATMPKRPVSLANLYVRARLKPGTGESFVWGFAFKRPEFLSRRPKRPATRRTFPPSSHTP